jgi:hypothetical protein
MLVLYFQIYFQRIFFSNFKFLFIYLIGNMNPNPLVTNNNGSKYQRCKGCEKTLLLNLFVINGKSYRTYNMCRIKNKEIYQQKKQQINAGGASIELIELCDYLSEILDSFEEFENKENVVNPEFTFSCTVNIGTLEGSPKEKAKYIIKEISDVDEYTWVKLILF